MEAQRNLQGLQRVFRETYGQAGMPVQQASERSPGLLPNLLQSPVPRCWLWLSGEVAGGQWVQADLVAGSQVLGLLLSREG